MSDLDDLVLDLVQQRLDKREEIHIAKNGVWMGGHVLEMHVGLRDIPIQTIKPGVPKKGMMKSVPCVKFRMSTNETVTLPMALAPKMMHLFKMEDGVSGPKWGINLNLRVRKA